MKQATPNEIANFFLESVPFDLKNYKITSYKQIKDRSDEFYTFIDREAFRALLNDVLYFDNQLKDIFCDLFDEELGIQCFADEEARKYPKMRINYFLSQPKYQYHKNNIAKIYFAINTWLLFFGESTIEPEWDNCPFCNSTMKNNKCTGIFCGKTKTESMRVSLELSELLADAKAGLPVNIPLYWYNIYENSEFYNDYKLPILAYTKKQRYQEEEKKQNVINDGIKEINKVRAMLKIEVDKEKPNFEQLLNYLSNSEFVKEANAYNDRSFTQRLNLLRKQIIKKQDECKEQKELDKKYDEFNKIIDDFLNSYTRLKSAMTIDKISLNAFKEILDNTNLLYENITVGLKKGYQIKKNGVTLAIKEFETITQVKATEFIVKKIEQDAITDAKNEFTAAINLILIELEKTKPSQNKSDIIEKKFIENIEKNHHFDMIRTNENSKYNYIVDPIRKRIASLIEEENKLKLDSFKKEYKELLEEINKSEKTDQSIKLIIDRLNLITNNDYYKSIKRNSEYIKLIGILTRKIDNLAFYDKTLKIEEQNKELQEKIKILSKENKILKLSTIISVSILIIIIIIILIIK